MRDQCSKEKAALRKTSIVKQQWLVRSPKIFGLESSAAHIQDGILSSLPFLMDCAVSKGTYYQYLYGFLFCCSPYICALLGSIFAHFFFLYILFSTAHTITYINDFQTCISSLIILLSRSTFSSAYGKSLPQAVKTQYILTWTPCMSDLFNLIPSGSILIVANDIISFFFIVV